MTVLAIKILLSLKPWNVPEYFLITIVLFHTRVIVKRYSYPQFSVDFIWLIIQLLCSTFYSTLDSESLVHFCTLIFSVQIHTPSRNPSSTAYYSPKDDSGNLKCRICENVYTHPVQGSTHRLVLRTAWFQHLVLVPTGSDAWIPHPVILPCQHTFCFGCIAAICR